MGMLKLVKSGDFLAASLNMELSVKTGKWHTASGVKCELLGRGILQITPPDLAEDTKDIVLSSGVHGDETSPIELVQQLARRILVDGLVPAHRLLLIIGHPEAINLHKRFVVENMNRLFNTENPTENPDCLRANELQQAVINFYSHPDRQQASRWHLDLHCAIRDSEHYTFAVSPFTENPTRSKALFSFMQRAELEAVLLSSNSSSTFSWFSAEKFSAQALTVELGKVAKFGENDLERLAAFDQAMLELVTVPQVEYHWQGDLLSIYKVTRTLVKQTDEFKLNFPNDQANFTFFDQGKLLGSDEGVEYFALEGGEAVVFPNANVALGQRACLLVRKTEVNLGEQITVK